MSKWRLFQKKAIETAISSDKSKIMQEDVSRGKVYGTIYYKKGTNPKRGLLLVHGIAGNRFGLGEFAKILANYGFFVLSIDLPSHFLNPNALSLGEASEAITEGVLLLKSYGMSRIAVIGHSLGAISALFSNAGYNKEIENHIYRLWEYMVELTEKEARIIRDGRLHISQLEIIHREIESTYTKLKQLIFYSIKKGVQENSGVVCYVFLAPPINPQGAFPGMLLMRKLKRKWVKIIIEQLLHKPLVSLIHKEGNIVKFSPEKDPDYISWSFLKTKEIYELLTYLADMKRPIDFLTLVEAIIKFRHKDGFTNFFEYYQKKFAVKTEVICIWKKRFTTKAIYSS